MWRGKHLLLQSRLTFQCVEFQSRSVSFQQNDKDIETRRRNLEKARSKYQLEQKTFKLTEDQRNEVNVVDVPPLIHTVPREENRSIIDMIRFTGTGAFYKAYQLLYGRGKWKIQDMINHFKTSYWLSKPNKPMGFEVWTQESVDNNQQTPLQRKQADHWFAWQRLNGVTRNLIRRVHEVPQQFDSVLDTIQDNHPYLEGLTLSKHAQNGTLYTVDLTDVNMGEVKPAAPMALFTVWKSKLLMPVAINIDANLPNAEVFTPSTVGTAKDVRAWVNARIWFNMVDAQFHESITHLGFTHMLMDGVSVCMHRNLSDRHPIYKLLLPHFQYMHIINKNAQDDLIEPGGFVDKDMYFGNIHMLKLIARHNKNWTYPTNASIHASLNSREANDIPGYFFRDDALRLHRAINQFVSEYASHYYRNKDLNVHSDQEIQSFRQELVRPRSMNGGGGCGMNGIPEFDNIQNLVDVLTNFIYICSVEHSATNFPQYDQYAFPPNMAATLHDKPYPCRSVLNLDHAMPNGYEMFSAIAVMKVLTLVLTNSLGSYESSYLNAMDNEGRSFVRKFQKDLAIIQKEIHQRNDAIIANNKENDVHEYPYEWLLPVKVLNSISI